MFENVKRPANFTYPEEEAMWHNDNFHYSEKDLYLRSKMFQDLKETNKEGEEK